MTQDDFNSGLLAFLQGSPTPFHAVANMAELLTAKGFTQIDEADEWQLVAGEGYFITRNESSIVAFRYQPQAMQNNGLRFFGAHTDSPCLKVKPNPIIQANGCVQLGVETYGGVLLNPWFDRDLSLAGRVHFATTKGEIGSTLIDLQQPIAVIPSLAIHLDREANENRTVNKQNHLPPLVALNEIGAEDFNSWLLQQVKAAQPQLDIAQVHDFDLSFYDSQAPSLIGLNKEFIASARLDNLLSCFVGLQALLSSDGEQAAVLVCNDHEEVGSVSAAGADGTMLQSVVARLAGGEEAKAQVLAKSMLISADNAHAVHPNYADRHDGKHGPKLNKGPVIKLNANQRYATNSETAAIFSQLCEQQQLPVQRFVVRSDMGCGSTIGPMVAANLGVRTVDVGAPQLAMHSIRELAGSADAAWLCKVSTAFFNREVC